MSRKPTSKSTGQVVVLDYDSKMLAGNALGDPHLRKVAVWLPPGYDQGITRGRSAGRGRRFPVLFDLVGFTGSGLAHLNWRPFDENVPERIARLIAQRRMGPTIVVFPDCFTSLGGNQYVNSSAIGRYADYLTRELIPFVDGEFRTLASREHRGCFGKSSGGYGAIIHAMRHAEHWGAVADHSGDALFDFCYFTDWPRTLNELDRYRRRRAARTRRRAARRARDRIGHRRRPRQALPRAHLGKGQARRRRSARADEPRDGCDVRSRSDGRRSASGCHSTSKPASSFRPSARQLSTLRSLRSGTSRHPDGRADGDSRVLGIECRHANCLGVLARVPTDSGWVAEHNMSEREVTHMYALTSATIMDATIGCWDAKLIYW